MNYLMNTKCSIISAFKAFLINFDTKVVLAIQQYKNNGLNRRYMFKLIELIITGSYRNGMDINYSIPPPEKNPHNYGYPHQKKNFNLTLQYITEINTIFVPNNKTKISW